MKIDNREKCKEIKSMSAVSFAFKRCVETVTGKFGLAKSRNFLARQMFYSPDFITDVPHGQKLRDSDLISGRNF